MHESKSVQCDSTSHVCQWILPVKLLKSFFQKTSFFLNYGYVPVSNTEQLFEKVQMKLILRISWILHDLTDFNVNFNESLMFV